MVARASAAYDLVLKDKSAAGRRSFLGGIDRIDKRMAALAIGGFAAAGAAGITAFGAIYATQGPVIDELGKLSEKLGVSVESLQAMKDAGERADVSFALIEKSVIKMTAAVSDAATGTGAAVKAIAELGLSAEELNRLSPDEQFKAISDALADIENRNDQLRLAEDFFGARGIDLIRLTSDAINQAGQEMRDLDIALTEVNVENVEQLNDAVQRLQRNATGARQVFLAEMAPAIRAVLTETFALNEGMLGVRSTSQTLASSLLTVVGFIGDTFNALDNSFDFVQLQLANANVFANTVTDYFEGTAESAAVLEESIAAAQALDDQLAGQTGAADYSDRLRESFEAMQAQAEAAAKAIEEQRAAATARAGVDTSGGVSQATSEPTRTRTQPISDGEEIEARIDAQVAREQEAAAAQEERERLQQEARLNRIREFGLTEEQLLIERQQRTSEFLDTIAANDATREEEIGAIKLAANLEYHDQYLELIRRRNAEETRLEKAQLAAGKSYVEQGLAFFAQQSSAADAAHKAAVAVRMIREGKEATIAAYKWGNSIAGPPGGALAAGVAIAYTGALIADAVGGGSTAAAPSSQNPIDENTAAAGTASDNALQSQQVTQVEYKVYFAKSDTFDREGRAARRLQEDIDAKRVDFGPNVQVTTNVFDYEEEFGT